MDIGIDLLAIAGLLFVLVKSADFLEDSFVHFATKLRLSPFIIGFSVLAFISSLPEMTVAVNSSLEGVPGLSIGNLIGATIVIMTLVIGLNAIKHNGLPFKGTFTFSYLLLSLILMLMMAGVVIDKRITRFEGALLLVTYVFTVILILRNSAARHTYKKKPPVPKNYRRLLVYGLAGTAVLLISANLLVNRAVHIAELLNIAPSLVGLVMLGVGTNIPELTVMVRSNGINKNKLAAGNFIGSATINAPILGVLAIMSPHNIVNFQPLIPALIILIGSIVLFGFLAFSNREITRREGYILVAIYLLWLATEGVLSASAV
jgi:cation:H+ antiporter